jgi:16S rRNA (adenine1518-N6/adenine1519-N6)-dimethyltransferase
MGSRSNIRAFKKWGQNFIIDGPMLDKIVRTVKPEKQDIMVEIGPGTGALTRLFAPAVKHLHAIEIDERMDEFLAPIQFEAPSFSYEFNDFLKWNPHHDLEKFRLVGNIPYYITSPIILEIFKKHERVIDAYLLMQKEVGKRLVAPHGSKQYGILSVYAALFAKTEYLFDISRHVFHPEPDVESCFVRFSFDGLKKYDDSFESQLRMVIRTSFNQRRKTLRNSLKGLLKAEGVDSVQFDLGLRPERLSPDDFVQLTQLIFDS